MIKSSNTKFEYLIGFFGNRYPFLGYSLDLDCLSANSKT